MSGSSQAQQLAQGLDALGIPLDGAAQGKLLAYLALLAKWNKVYALTALRDQDKAVSHHLLDSLAILPFVDALAPANVLDVGSGGGQPGIPLAIARPSLAVTLLDSNSKKVGLLEAGCHGTAPAGALPPSACGWRPGNRNRSLRPSPPGPLPRWPISSVSPVTCWRPVGAGWR